MQIGGQRDGLPIKAPVTKPEFNPHSQHGGGKEPILRLSSDLHTWTVACVHTSIHTHAYTQYQKDSNVIRKEFSYSFDCLCNIKWSRLHNKREDQGWRSSWSSRWHNKKHMNLKEELQNLQSKTHAWKRPIIKPTAVSGFFLALLYNG